MAVFPSNKRYFLFTQNAQLDEDSNQKYQCHNEEKKPHNGLQDRVLRASTVRSVVVSVVDTESF